MMKRGSLVHYHLDDDKNKRLYVVYDVELNYYYEAMSRVNVVCPKTTKKFWFFLSDLKELKNESR